MAGVRWRAGLRVRDCRRCRGQAQCGQCEWPANARRIIDCGLEYIPLIHGTSPLQPCAVPIFAPPCTALFAVRSFIVSRYCCGSATGLIVVIDTTGTVLQRFRRKFPPDWLIADVESAAIEGVDRRAIDCEESTGG